jgi:glutamine amidotransferase
LIAVLDYGIGNLRSAEKSLQRAGGDAHLVSDPTRAMDAAGVVLPGVGAFGPCMRALRASGLDEVAMKAVDEGKPFLGICVGMQLLYEESEEDPGVAGLGLLEGRVVRLPPGEKRPQMQWNQLELLREESRLLRGCGPRPWFYFLHSFAPELTPAAVAVCDYGGSVVAAVETAGIWATQFHPEKSGLTGLRLLENFVLACGPSTAAARGAR